MLKSAHHNSEVMYQMNKHASTICFNFVKIITQVNPFQPNVFLYPLENVRKPLVLRFIDSPYILPLCEANLEDSIDSSNFSVRGYLLVIRKDFVSHMHSLAVYVKEVLGLTHDLFLEN